MNLFLYHFISSLAGLLAWPWFYYHLKSRGRGESFGPRLGLSGWPAPPAGTPRIWLHGVSVGEILAALPLVLELRARLPQAALIVSTGTETGQAVARRHYLPVGARVCYFPLDLPWAVHRALNRLKPDVFVALESEIWPGFLSLAHRRGVALALMNARLSDRSFRRYWRFKGYVIDILNLFMIIAPGSREDHQRLVRLGVSPAKLCFTGNLKVDALLARREVFETPPCPSGWPVDSRPSSGSSANPGALRKLLGPPDSPVFLAASTHPGEEEVVLEAYHTLRVPYPSLVLVLAPRHPERVPKLAELLTQQGLGFHLWQTLKAGAEPRRQPVVLVDTVGELMAMYGAADAAFVGGSLVPRGGQNLLEPAAWGLPPIHGPHLENFRWAEEILRDAGVSLVVRDGASLAWTVGHLLKHPEESRRLGEAARRALLEHRGAAARQAELIVALAGMKSGRAGDWHSRPLVGLGASAAVSQSKTLAKAP